MKTIVRKTLLYKTKVGTGGYCVNHVQGCSHGCRYPCYAYDMAHSHGRISSYKEWCEPKIVANALDLLDKEILKMKNRIPFVHLCFSTDPFMYGVPAVIKMSLQIIEKLNAAGIPCHTLTKGIIPQELADEKRFLRTNEYGISLVSLDEKFRSRWEPGAAPYKDRIASLEYLHKHGCAVFVRMEPYPTPNIIEQNIVDILNAVSFAESISFSGWNYNSIIKKYPDYKVFYHQQERIIENFCKEKFCPD